MLLRIVVFSSLCSLYSRAVCFQLRNNDGLMRDFLKHLNSIRIARIKNNLN